MRTKKRRQLNYPLSKIRVFGVVIYCDVSCINVQLGKVLDLAGNYGILYCSVAINCTKNSFPDLDLGWVSGITSVPTVPCLSQGPLTFSELVPGIPENEPPIFEAHELLSGEFTQIEAYGLLKINSSLLCNETVLTDFVLCFIYDYQLFLSKMVLFKLLVS